MYTFRHNNQHEELSKTPPSWKQSMSCGRPRTQETGGNSPVRHEAAPKPKLISLGFSKRVILIPAKASTKRDCEFGHISRHFTEILRHGGCHEADWAVRWDHMSSAEQTQCWNKEEKWIDAPGRSTDKPKMECCEDPNGTMIHIRAVQGHSHGARNNPTLFSLTKILFNGKERKFHTDSSSNCKSILENGLWAGGLSLRSTRQACFFSPLNPQNSSSRQRTIDWSEHVKEPRMVLCKQSYRHIMSVSILSINDEFKTQI